METLPQNGGLNDAYVVECYQPAPLWGSRKRLHGDREQAPLAGHTFKFVTAAVFELQP